MPYLIIAGAWYAIKYFLLVLDPISFLYELSTLSFWIRHKGAWYVAMLIPLYAIYPILYDFIEKRNRKYWTLIIIAFVLLLSLILYKNNKPIYEHLSQIFNSVIVFTIGSYCGKAMIEDKKFPYALLVTAIIFYPIRASIPEIKEVSYLGNMSYAMLGLGACLVCALILGLLPKWILRLFEFLGNISLELYLTNIFLLQALNIAMERFSFPDANNWIHWVLIYFAICVIGLVLSYFVRILCSRILNNIV